MREVLIFLALLIIFAVAAFVVPVGLAIYDTWTPAQTASLVTGAFAVCGGAVALAALGFGVAAGASLFRRERERRSEQPAQPAPTVQVLPQGAVTDYEHWRAQRAMIEAQRAALLLQRERQSLQQPAAASDPAASDWVLIDDSAAAEV